MPLALKARLVILAATLAASASSFAQDPVKVAPGLCRVSLENEHVRLFESIMQPGDKLPMHSHPRYVVYALTTATLRFRSPEGKTGVVNAVPGMAVWREPETHEVENIGATESRVLHVELKSSSSTTTAGLSAPPQ